MSPGPVGVWVRSPLQTSLAAHLVSYVDVHRKRGHAARPPRGCVDCAPGPGQRTATHCSGLSCEPGSEVRYAVGRGGYDRGDDMHDDVDDQSRDRP